MLVATGAAALIGTLLAVYGLLMSPIGWAYAGIVWSYCLGLFLVQDRVKILAFKVFGREHEHSGILARTHG